MFATWLHICAFPGCIETALSHWKSGCFASWAQLHKLPEPAHRPTSKQPDVEFTLKKKKKPCIFSHFPWPFEWLTWSGSKKIYNNILGMQDGNRQPDRQKKKEHNCWSALLHQELKPHEAAVFASDHDHSLIDVDEFQNRTKTSKIKARCLFCLITLSTKQLLRALLNITRRVRSLFTVLHLSHRLLLTPVQLSVIRRNASIVGSCINTIVRHEETMSSDYVFPISMD